MLEYRCISATAAGLTVGLLAASVAFGQTFVPGGNLGNQNWGPWGSPYVIQGDVVVTEALNIDPGTVILFDSFDLTSGGRDPGRVEFDVAAGGMLLALGVPLSPVSFEGTIAGSGTWYGITLAPGSGQVILDEVTVSGAVVGLNPESGSGETILRNAVFRDSETDLSVPWGYTPTIQQSLTATRLEGYPVIPSGASFRLQEPAGYVAGDIQFVFGSTFHASLRSAYDSDRLRVQGLALLEGSLDLDASSMTATSGEHILLIDNESDNPNGGEFAGLPEGMIWLEDGVELGITYVGGTGNDVVIEVDPLAWPDDNAWTALADPATDILLQSPGGEFAQLPFDLVGTVEEPLAYVASNDRWYFYRVRLAGSPMDTPIKFHSLVVRILLEFDFFESGDSFDYEILFSGADEEVRIAENEVEESGWCGDASEWVVNAYSAPPDLTGHARVVDAGTMLGFSGDWFLDLRVPIDDFLVDIGLSPDAAEQVVIGTSSNVGYVNKDSANLDCWSDWSISVSDVPTTGTGKWTLHQNLPNPFNPQTTIAFDMPKQTTVNLRVFDVSGRLVDVLLDNDIAAQGRNEVVWRGGDEQGRVVPAGVYFYSLESGGYSETKRMVLVK